MKRWRLALVAGGLLALGAAQGAAQACTTPEQRQFDFWIGEWDAYDAGKPDSSVARLRVERMVGGCALREVYQGKSGLTGESFSAYDAARGVWHQSWVTNRGQLLLLDGNLAGSRMVLSGPYPLPNRSPGIIRGVWYVVPGGVRETAETSEDGGKTWKPLFDLVFRPRAP